MADHLSQKQLDANRRNALRSTGPATEAGKARSRRNGLKHGFAAESVLPEIDRDDLDLALERWEREAGPDNVVEEHMVRKAAIASVTLDRIEAARESTRTDAAREAVRAWERAGQHAARRRGQDLRKDPVGVVADLRQTAFGCDWLVRQWERLDASLRIGGSWDRPALDRAQHLLGLPEGVPGVDAEEEVRLLWILAGALAPDSLPAVPRVGPECGQPTDPVPARAALRDLVSAKVDRLLDLREDSWEAVEGPEALALAHRHAAADTSKDGQLRQRYANAADRSCNAAVRLYLNVRDRHRRYLLDVAKEARQNDTPRAPVGHGWWREPDSAPAPPGFRKLTPAELAVDAHTPDHSPSYAFDPPSYACDPSPSVDFEPVLEPEPLADSPSPSPSPDLVPGPLADRPPVEPPPEHRSAAPLAPSPARSEPISEAATSTHPDRNLNTQSSLQPGASPRPAVEPLRTLPVHPRSSPGGPIPEAEPIAPPRRPDRSRRNR